MPHEPRAQPVPSLPLLLDERAALTPDLPLYTFLVDGDERAERLRCADLQRQARAIGVALAELAPAGERALLLYPPGLDYIAGFFGCLYAGLIAVPAYPPDPSRLERTLPRLRAIIADAEARVILTTSPIAALAGLLGEQAEELRALRWLSTDTLPGDAATAAPVPAAARALRRSSLAFLQYTSGSTGEPKGVMLSHGNLLENLAGISRAFGAHAGSAGVIWLPPYHDMGLIGGILVPLYQGFPVTLLSPLDFLRRPRRWLEAVTRCGATISGGPNFAYDLCVRKIPAAEREGLDLGSWEVAFCGAEPVRGETLARFAAAFGGRGFRRAALYPCYGLAEATLMVTGGERLALPVERTVDAAALEAGRVEPAAQGAARALVGCGQPMPGHTLVIAHPDTRVPCAPGEVGEIWVAGPSVAQGYWRRPEATAQAFGARLDDGQGPFLRTGDLGVVADGALYVTGRLKDLIILRGRNLYPQDLELTVETCHAALRPGCGAAFSVEVNGEEQLVVVHEVEPRRLSDAGVSLTELVRRVRQRVTEAHEVAPWAVVLVEAGRVPKTSSGKVQRHACRAAFLGGHLEALARWQAAEVEVAEAQEVSLAGETRAPVRTSRRREDLEAWLIERLCARTRSRRAEVEREAPLTRSGLDSLGAMELSYDIEGELGVVLPLEVLLGGMSVVGLAAEIERRQGDGRARSSASQRAPERAPEHRGQVPRGAGEHAPERAPVQEGQTPRGAGEHGTEVPLSSAQERLYFLERLAPGQAVYHIPAALELRGRLDVEALERALGALVERHEALRTSFRETAAGPVQVIGPARPVPLLRLDLGRAGELPPAEREAEARRRAEAEARRPFDLGQGPLLRAALLGLEDERHLFLVTVHHLVADGWSLGVMLREWAALYGAFCQDQGPTRVEAQLQAQAQAQTTSAALPAPGLQYADHVRWQRDWLAGETAAAQLEYWRGQLAGVPEVLALPSDRPRPAVRAQRGALFEARLPGGLWEEIQALARREGATPFMVLLAAFEALLHRYSGQAELCVGTATAGRAVTGRRGAEGPKGAAGPSGCVGLFVNAVALRSRWTPAASFREFLGQTRATVLAAHAHEELPFEKVVEALAPSRSLSHTPLFQVMLVLQPDPLAPLPPSVLPGLEASLLEVDTGTAKFDLTLALTPSAEGLRGRLEYDVELFDASTIERLWGHFVTLLTAAVRAPERRVSALPLLTPAERGALVRGGGPAAGHGPTVEMPPACLHTLFEAQVDRRPDALAVLHGDTCLSYRDLDEQANRLAHRLIALGVGPEVPVGLCLDRSPELVVAVLAVLKAGGAYVPLDPSYPRERLRFLIEDAAPAVLITEARFRELVSAEGDAPSPGRHGTRLLCLGEDAARLGEEPTSRPAAAVHPESLAYVIYTSGSTGQPKGVQIAHAQVARLFASTAPWFGFGPEDVWTLFHSYAFDFSVWELWGALLHGGRLVVVPFTVSRSPEAFHELLAAEGVTVLNQTPSAFRALLQADARAPGRRLALRDVIFGGEALDLGSLAPWFERHGDERPRLVNMYGITETTVHVTFRPLAKADAAPGTPGWIGAPIPDLELHVLDAAGELLPLGVPGELYVGGAGLGRGYLGRPALTAERFVPDPLSGRPGARLYRTGDRARRHASGELEYLGRVDHQVKLRGFRIELGEIEAALGQHPGVHEAVVALREDEPGDPRLVAYVVSRPGQAPEAAPEAATEAATEAAELRAFLKERLPEYMVPATFMVLEGLPLTSSGKVDRKALPAPERRRTAIERVYVAPRTARERAVAAAWATVLGLDRVGREDHFFEDLGGSSLLAVRAASLMRERLGQEVPIVHFFEHPTVAAMAARLGPAEATPAQAVATPGPAQATPGPAVATPAQAVATPGQARAGALRERPAAETGGIAIVGMAGRFPGAGDLGEFWRNMCAGVESISRLGEEELESSPFFPEALRREPAFVPVGGLLEGAELFDARFFDISPREARWMDPQQRVFLECVWAALEDAGCDPARYEGAIALYAGAGPSGHALALAGQAAQDPASLFELVATASGESVATKVSYQLGLRGESINVYTACSTGLVAVHMACQSLLAGQSEVTIAGAVRLVMPQKTGYLYQEGMILSPDGHCRPFDARAAGTVPGNGVGAVVLKRLEDALRDGDTIYAVIRGSAINNDAHEKVSYTAPSVTGQVAVIARALGAAGVAPESIGYVEAHGTGTRLGDPIEMTAIGRVFGGPQAGAPWCAIGSVKSNLGHLDTAAGMAGLIKAALALHHRTIPPSLH
ncbi:MAG TPA: amino acid adenylation domain-containing protein, partial [Polyangia bacterium]|nr:amino acid adenylation domain-containing protein [Polyangia bacterium]